MPVLSLSIYDFPPIRALIELAYIAVTALSDLLLPVAGDTSAALAVIVMTVLLRILLIPVGRSQVKAGIMRQRLGPQIAALQEKYRDRPEQLRARTMELYAAEKASPLAGCLPVLAQTPILMAVYGLFILPTIGGGPNQLLTHSFLGIPLGSGLLGQLAGGTAALGTFLVFGAIVVLVAGVAQASRKLLAPVQAAPVAAQSETPDLTGVTRMLSYLPFVTAFMAMVVPLAAALYLLTTSTWTLGERLVLRRLWESRPGFIDPAR